MAVRTFRRMMSGSPIVNAYTFDDSILREASDLKPALI